MLEKLLEISGGKFLVPVIFVVAATFLVKGFFSLNRSRTSDRRDFLEMWLRSERSERGDDLWLEVSIRHLFGTYLPAVLIRSLMHSPQSARALREVSDFWELLEMDDETQEITWKKSRHATGKSRKRMSLILNIAYFFSMGSGLLIMYLAIASSPGMTWLVLFWIYGVMFAGLGMACLHHAEKISTANLAGPRWLGLP